MSTVRLRTVSPVASSSRRARSANASAPIAVNISYAMRSCSRASTRRFSRRSHSPYSRWARARWTTIRVRRAARSPRGRSSRRPAVAQAGPASAPIPRAQSVPAACVRSSSRAERRGATSGCGRCGWRPRPARSSAEASDSEIVVLARLLGGGEGAPRTGRGRCRAPRSPRSRPDRSPSLAAACRVSSIACVDRASTASRARRPRQAASTNAAVQRRRRRRGGDRSASSIRAAAA